MCTRKTGTVPTKKMVNDNRGFTLVELLIAVAIVGILAAIAIPAYNGYIAISKKKAAESVLEQFPVLIESYRAENGMMCPTGSCDTTGVYTYAYTEAPDGSENTVGNKITLLFPDFRAKGLTADVSLYDYQVIFTVTGCPTCTESADATAIPVAGRGAPTGNIVGDTYQ